MAILYNIILNGLPCVVFHMIHSIIMSKNHATRNVHTMTKSLLKHLKCWQCENKEVL